MPPFLSGLAASLSIATGYFPVAISFGLSAVEAGLAPSIAVLISVLVYAGASQFLLISLLASGAGLPASVSTILLMNARHLFYGPALARLLQPALPANGANTPAPLVPVPALAFGLTDEVFATAMSRIGRIPPAARPLWFLGLSCGSYAAWVLGSATGAFVVGDISQWPLWLRQALGFVLPALFFTLLLENGIRPWRFAIGAAALCALAALPWLPGHHALLLAIAGGAIGHSLALRLGHAIAPAPSSIESAQP